MVIEAAEEGSAEAESPVDDTPPPPAPEPEPEEVRAVTWRNVT